MISQWRSFFRTLAVCTQPLRHSHSLLWYGGSSMGLCIHAQLGPVCRVGLSVDDSISGFEYINHSFPWRSAAWIKSGKMNDRVNNHASGCLGPGLSFAQASSLLFFCFCFWWSKIDYQLLLLFICMHWSQVANDIVSSRNGYYMLGSETSCRT